MLLLLLLLGPSPALGAHVTQEPSRAIRRSGASLDIRCRAEDFQAMTVLWYRQFPQQGLTLMATSNQGASVKYEEGFTEAAFPINHRDLKFFNLTVASAQPADSGLHLCAASDTALARDERPSQEPVRQPPLPHPTPAPRSPVGGSGAGRKPQLP
uniref:Ig-like domain-containing protein n=1 Tax=Rousettus aegyptiacus TaxID=9407 RepID=A0A7J8D7D9_ROUAE|nr:hypothetical protein HJG63_008859 [Rousettus aegyptiacus]